jgi:hypothetical protein
MELNIDPKWLLDMAEKENNCCISVGGRNYLMIAMSVEIEELLEVAKPDYKTRCRLFDLGKKEGMQKCIEELRRLAKEAISEAQGTD